MRRVAILLSLACLAGSFVVMGAPKKDQNRGNEKQKRERGGNTESQSAEITAANLTDAQVVASMKRGIDFLLHERKGDNWESGKNYPREGNRGGETALVLYALLHAGQSLTDDPEYAKKLSFRGPELSAAVTWLSKLEPQETYTAGLQASALTLLPKRPDEKPGEGVRFGLDADKFYFLTAMGMDGGYTYGPLDVKKGSDLVDAWHAYYQAAQGNDTKATSDAKKALDDRIRGMRGSFGGPEAIAQKMLMDMRKDAAAKRAAKDNAGAGRIDQEATALENYLIQFPSEVGEASAAVDKAAQEVDDLDKRIRTNNLRNLKGKDGKKGVTQEEAKGMLADAQKKLGAAQQRLAEVKSNAEANFEPVGDLSNSQYGALGAWALMDYGMEMPNAYWTVTDKFWRRLQKADGSWPYAAGKGVKDHSSDGMTVAGIASLFIAQEFVDVELRRSPKQDKNIDAGLAWLNANFKADTGDFYFLYGVERVGLATGLKFFGTTDWYREGAVNLLKRQSADGSWDGGYYDANPNTATAYALLFLARGRNPIVFNKLQYNGNWNARPRDDANITRWMGKRFEKAINWQVVNLQVNPEQWQDAPILYLTGSVDPKFSEQDIAKLRSFIEAGGMIVSSADESSKGFTDAMRKTALAVSGGRYEMRQLPKDHLLFSNELGVKIPTPPVLLGMSNGTRELWIHAPNDIGAAWQQRRYAGTDFELGAGLYFYASGQASLRSKLAPLTVPDSTAKAAHKLTIARIIYDGNPDPEPGAWPRMAKIARRDFATDLAIAPVKCTELDPKKYRIAHMTGTTRFGLSNDEVAALKSYLDRGGILFADAAGGSPEFTHSFLELERQLYLDKTPEVVASNNPIVAGTVDNGTKLGEVDFRRYGNLFLKHRVTEPALEAINIDGKAKIVFSKWDITSGFLGTNTWGIVGYAPPSAEILGRNILMYAMKPLPIPPPPQGAGE